MDKKVRHQCENASDDKKRKYHLFGRGVQTFHYRPFERWSLTGLPLTGAGRWIVCREKSHSSLPPVFAGLGWALSPPLATAALWINPRSNNVVSMDDTGVSYTVFVVTGTMLWQVFSEAISTPLAQVTENKTMLSKINIPREGLLLSGLYQLIFNTVIKVLLLAVMFLAFRQVFSLSSLIFVPVGSFWQTGGFRAGLPHAAWECCIRTSSGACWSIAFLRILNVC
ncbi:MAG: hypothetical protein IPO22_19430 [Anaerolineales bacterium]|nr:hypothetical protein [Anaerolineales bacterium]